MKLWIGTSGFQYPEWKGKFYPVQMPASRMLAFYADHFSTTEVNYTFRRIPAAKTIQDWSDKTPAAFRFSFKAPQRVTHFSKLRGCAEVLGVFAAAIDVARFVLGATAVRGETLSRCVGNSVKIAQPHWQERRILRR